MKVALIAAHFNAGVILVDSVTLGLVCPTSTLGSQSPPVPLQRQLCAKELYPTKFLLLPYGVQLQR